MELQKWDPWKEFGNMFDHYAKVLPQLPLGNQEVLETGDWIPRVDITETDKEFIIKAEIPGVMKEDVSVTVDNRIMTIRGEKKREEEEKGKTFHRVERHYGSFTRSFTLPDNINEKTIKASFNDGLLNLHIQKAEGSKSKAREIKVE